MFCLNCGEQIEENSKFCKKCGTQIEKKEELNKKEGLGMLFVAIFGGIIFLSAIVYVLDSVMPKKEVSKTTKTVIKQEKKKNNLEVIESYPCNLGYGLRGICGKVKNNSSCNVGYAQVEINLYDKKGNLIDSTIDNINNVEPNSTWIFEAPVINDRVTTYKIKNLTMF